MRYADNFVGLRSEIQSFIGYEVYHESVNWKSI